METNQDGHTKKRFLFSIVGGYGHLHPLMPLARALQQRGHEIAFAVSRSLRPIVEASGFAVLQVGGNLTTDPEFQQFDAQRDTMPLSLETELFIYSRLWCGIAPRLRTPQLVEVAREWQPDMLIREAGEYGAVIAAEHLGLPHAVVSVTASLKAMAIFEREAASQLDPIRAHWGLPPDPTLAFLYRYLFLAYSPPTFSLHDVTDMGGPGAPGPIPSTTHFIRPEFFDNAAGESLPDWLARLPESGQPLVYVTLGTEVNNEPGVYPNVLQTIIAGLRDLPLNLIVTLGRDKDPADFGLQPSNVHIERYIPQSLLLAHCDLAVIHGGSNTLLQALDIGLPVVVVPLIADQFFNGAVTQSLRLGQVVQSGDLAPATIRAAAEEVLANPVYRQNAGRLRAEMHALPGQDYAVELVERVAADHEAVR
jgi:UDP:flavonoid glycosyltransferase YjiC (YdhE family)